MKIFSIMQTAYNNFDTTVNRYLSKVFNSLGINNNHTQIFTIIFDAIKGIMQNAMFYIEDALTEQNIFTATRKKSIYNLAKISGYSPFYGSAANGTLVGSIIRGSLLDNDANKIFIPNKTQILNRETGVKYILILPSNEYVIDISKPLIKHEFKIVEGSIKINTFYSEGLPFETFHVNTSLLFDKNNIKVLVNNIQYTLLDCIYDMSEGSNECVFSVGYDNDFSITFGNGIYGKKLTEGQTIKIEWLSHNGSRGNVYSNDTTKFSWQSKGRDSFGNSIDLNKFIKLKMNNCISGGINEDSIETIRQMIGYNSRSLVLATEENFKLFFKRFSFIGRVNCWSEENSMYIIAACLSDKIINASTVDKYLNLNINDLYISEEQKEQVITTLANSNRTFAGVTIKFINPIIRRFAIVCFIKIKDSFNKESVKEQIKDIIVNYFINLPDDILQIYKTDIITNVMNNVSDIEFFDCTIISELAEQTYKDGYYEKYELVFSNNTFNYVTKKVFYEAGKYPGLDNFGNIKLDSKLEIPILHGGFNYYYRNENQNNKDLYNNEFESLTSEINSSINSTKIDEPIQFYFI